MEKKCGEEKWTSVNLAAVNVHQEEEEEEEEALSLCDLPLIHHSRKEKEKEDKEEEEEEESIPLSAIEAQEDFDFCSLSKESEMCAADEVFFQGQILPLRHSVGSEKGLLHYFGSSNGSRVSISRSESMDCYSSGLISSRSSSISSSHQSSSSSGSSTTTTPPKHKLVKPPQNHFHSHPSPSPRIKFPSNKRGIMGANNNNRNCANKSSSVWNIFRLGLVTTPPEIAFQDLKTRCPNNTNSKNFGSRNSTSSNASSSISSNGNKINNPEKKKKPRALLGGCKCTIDAVDTVRSRVVNIKKSGSESECTQALGLEEDNVPAVEPMKSLKQQAAKKQLSHHRTFEWLKQLSLEATADEA